jgi:hypothetical protein
MEQYLSLLFTAVAACLLGLMCYQDWQARSISWPAFPALSLALLAVRLQHQPAVQLGYEVLLNWAVVVAMVATLWLYVRLRFGSVRLQDYLGSGDVLYWVIVAVYFSPVGFLAYFLGSSIVALLVAGLLQWHHRSAMVAIRIPLAGVQAACLLALIGLQEVAPTSTAYWANNMLPTI